MRSVLAAAVLALPALLPAQALHSGVSHLVASVDAPAFAFQASAVRAAAPRVFTGLIAPIRLNALQLAPATYPAGEVTVEYTVDTAGVPQDVQVTKPMDKATNDRVVEAVRRVRYTPGKLDGEPTAMPVTLHVALGK